MAVYKHATTFAGYPVVEWAGDKDVFEHGTNIAVAIRTEWDEGENAWDNKFNDLLKHESVAELPALVIGMWHEPYEHSVASCVSALIQNKDRLPNLKAIFVADIVADENEISWIIQADLSPLLRAFPNLEYLTIRGGTNLALGDLYMPKLKSLRIESGGLSGEVVRSVAQGKFPELEALVLWLGTVNYGSTVTFDDLQGFYECKGMPKLKYLGLCDSDIADKIAEFIAMAPVLERIDVLDMSLGTLSDEGALALLTSPYIRKLKKLDIHYHFCTKAMMDKLQELTQDGVEVDTSQQQTERDWRFVAVGE